MKAYDIRIYPDPVLTLKSEKVEKFDDELREIIDSMRLTLQISGGVGLAAPQIGISKCIAIIVRDEQQYILINPELIESSGNVTSEEGCLSFPEIFAQVTRPNCVKIKTNCINGEVKFFEVDGYIARAFLHEMDHLEGKLFIDHISPLKRGVIRKKMKKRASNEKNE
ncbi:MAG: peptide deformylase [Synergistaceae bacterium]|nr:peptide deformylase [Synergistaceae bacterium]